jgi:methionyl-tRNA formyltransferase
LKLFHSKDHSTVSIRIVFMGTGNLALPSFLALLGSSHQVVGLVTQPDRTGRGHHQHVNPLKVAAAERRIAVLQPDSIKTPEAIADLVELKADLFVVAAYGQMLSPEVLSVPRLGTINIHASLLPRYRGATPIHAAILNGDAETGVTIIEIEPKMDAGPMLGRIRTPIDPNETTGQLEQRLADLAVPLTLRVIDEIVAGTVSRELQDPAQVTRVRKLSKLDGRIDWKQSAEQIARHVRGMQPWPGPFTELHQPNKPPLRLQILSVEVVPDHLKPQLTDPKERSGEPTGQESSASCGLSESGLITGSTDKQFVIGCGSGELAILSLQPDGKRPMSAAEFLRGRRVAVGDRFE